MSDQQLTKLVDALGSLDGEMQVLNKTMHDIDLCMIGVENSFDAINAGLNEINDKLDEILKGNK